MSSWVDARPRRPLSLGVGVIAALVGAGVAAVVPTALVVALVVAVALLVLLLVARGYVAGASVGGGIALEPGHAVAVGADGAVVARYLYFAGMLTIGQTTVRPLAGFTLSDWLFFAALSVVLVDLATRERKVRFAVPTVVVIGVVLFVVSGLLSSFDAAAPLLSVAKVLRFGYLTVAWFWLGTLVLTRPRHLRAAVAMWVLSVAADGLGAVLQARGLPVPYLGPVMWGRMTGFTAHVNDLGGAAAVAMAPAFALIFTAVRLGSRILWTLVLLAIVVAAVLSGSVGGMATGLGAVGVWLVVSSRGPRPLVVALVALSLAMGVAQVQSQMGLPTPVQRVLAATGFSQGGRYSTVETRLEGYGAAWAGVGQGGWIGHGLDAESALVEGRTEIHNVFLKAWYEAGWAAAVGMLCVMFGGLRSSLIAARISPTKGARALVAGVFAAVVAFIFIGLSAPVLHQRYGWVAVALAVSSWAMMQTGRSALIRGDVDE